MRRVALIGLVIALAVAGFCQPVLADKRVALVIGNGAYQNAAMLSNPPRDAEALAVHLRDAGFDLVLTRHDLPNLEFKRVLREFNLAALNADIAVVFFAGHGIEISGINYLLPVDAKLQRDFDVEDEAVTLDRLVRAVEPAQRLRLIILDACRDNPFVRTIQRNGAVRSVANGLSKIEPMISDTLVADAAKAGSFSEDGDAANSPFTLALLKHLFEPGLDIRLALGRVRDEVLKSTGNRQEPFVYGSLGGASISLVAAPPREIEQRERHASVEARRIAQALDTVNAAKRPQDTQGAHEQVAAKDRKAAASLSTPVLSPGAEKVQLGFDGLYGGQICYGPSPSDSARCYGAQAVVLQGKLSGQWAGRPPVEMMYLAGVVSPSGDVAIHMHGAKKDGSHVAFMDLVGTLRDGRLEAAGSFSHTGRSVTAKKIMPA
jgi:uncharacterized caspase-like protein